MNTIYLYDGTVNGAFCAIARAIKEREQPEDIRPKHSGQGGLFAIELYVETDDEQVERLWEYLNRELTDAAVNRILLATLYDGAGWELALHDYIKLSIKLREQLAQYHAHPVVQNLHSIADKVLKEVHLFKGILRFREMKNGVLYAPLTPDHKISYPLSIHFKDRLGGEKWILHDLKHQSAIFWDGQQIVDIELDEQFLMSLSGDGRIDPKWLSHDELDYQEFWRQYFDSIAIEARENKRLQKRFMPQRYWKYLTEM